MASPYGKRGGEGPTAGRRASVYEATAPDGTVLRRRSFKFHEAEGPMACHEHAGVWYEQGVYAARPDWAGEATVMVPARLSTKAEATR